MREFSVAAVLAAALALAGEARAQSGAMMRSGGAYGGGLIEMLMTGHDPGPAMRPVRPMPAEVTRLPARAPYAYGPPPGYEGGEPERPSFDPRYAAPPAAVQAPRLAEPDPRFRRQEVDYPGPHRPGSIIVDTPARHLYLVQPGGRALRYGIGVGRPGFTWAGLKTVTAKREWPDWTPPAEMLRRRPDLPRHMAGGPENPLGARALYLGSSLYRIHGTNEPNTIGQSVSSGCIRMMNDDVVDLYERVGVGTQVHVI